MESICKTVVIEGEDYRFPRILLEDLFQFESDLQAEREAAVRKLAKEEKLDHSAVLLAISKIRSTKPGYTEILDYCSSPTGIKNVVNRSMSKDRTFFTPERQKKVWTLRHVDLMALATDLIADDPQPVEEEKPFREGTPETPAEVQPDAPQPVV